ncbi:spore coat protein U-like protein [Altererythrobacter atlanticus]|uniref:Spore Coat Protein U domain protein n=1 Tax=Croceibacterium atlanticum TaxID=1267766 RepID=A0A0F7KXF7_9SPHN|nr:spore coat U domain-containing protein [Croceibacterium atlanticum]AKH43882.1 Spore Coat Protein U domain protein [Croceibacterium atlanticum]MBB5733668.1 spore coat protein U-like protein [Croceibacterium atlanticum]
MPLTRFRAAILALLLGALFLLWPERAAANVVCSLASHPVTLAFGTSMVGSGEVRYTCRNYDPRPRSFTICTAPGTPSFPGTIQQPVMISGNNRQNFNIYSDSAATVPWTSANPINRAVTVAAGGTATGSLPFYGRIASGQLSTVGNYQAFFFNVVLGFLSPTGQGCQPVQSDLNGLDFTLFVTASVTEACSLGTTEAVDFGTPAGLWTRADAAGAVQVSCPGGVRWSLGFGAGMHAVGGERRMQSGEGNYVPYRLYRDAARSMPIGVDEAIVGSGNGAVQSVPVYGRVDLVRPPPVGNYSDRIIVVLSF